MADDVDFATDRIEKETSKTLEQFKGYQIPEGKEGNCDTCGEWSSRLIGGMCAPCRDKYEVK